MNNQDRGRRKELKIWCSAQCGGRIEGGEANQQGVEYKDDRRALSDWLGRPGEVVPPPSNGTHLTLTPPPEVGELNAHRCGWAVASAIRNS